MAVVTITLTDLPPDGAGKSYVRLQLKSDPRIHEHVDTRDPTQVTLAQLMGLLGAQVIKDALEEHFAGQAFEVSKGGPTN